MKNKGFTLVELLGVIVVLAIIGGIATLAITNYIGNSKEKVYRNYVATLKTTVEDYLIDDFAKNGNLLPNVGGSRTFTLEELIDAKVIEELKDPNGGIWDPRETEVIVTRKEDIVPDSDFKFVANIDLTYDVSLDCPGATVTCENYTKADNCDLVKK